MKRRIFSVLLSSALLLTALAGCGQGGEADPSGSPSDAESEICQLSGYPGPKPPPVRR